MAAAIGAQATWSGSYRARSGRIRTGQSRRAGVRVVPQPGKLTASLLLDLGPNGEVSARIWAGLPPLPGLNRLHNNPPACSE
jgi:hypothetical protein